MSKSSLPHRVEWGAAQKVGTTTAAEHFGHRIVCPAYWSPNWYLAWHAGIGRQRTSVAPRRVREGKLPLHKPP